MLIFPHFGIGSDDRKKSARESELLALLDRYERTLPNTDPELFHQFTRQTKGNNTALLCYEDDPQHCHR
jgi:uncharacterized protein (DUF488 family)